MRNYFVEKRKKDKQDLLNLINQNPDLIEDEKRLIGLFSLKTGLRASTIQEYLQELKDAGVVK